MASPKYLCNVYVKDVKVAGPLVWGNGGGTDTTKAAEVTQLLQAALDSKDHTWTYAESDIRIECVDTTGSFIESCKLQNSRTRSAQRAEGVKFALSLGLANCASALPAAPIASSAAVEDETSAPQPMVRIQLDLPADQVKELEDLMKETKIVTRKDLFSNTLTLFQWAAKEKRVGRIIASFDDATGTARELVMPALENISKPQSAARAVTAPKRGWLAAMLPGNR